MPWGGGDSVVHSRELAFHGFLGAFSPERQLLMQFQKKKTWKTSITNKHTVFDFMNGTLDRLVDAVASSGGMVRQMASSVGL